MFDIPYVYFQTFVYLEAQGNHRHPHSLFWKHIRLHTYIQTIEFKDNY